jgi:ketosteroid isomerase-like protein
MKSFSMLAAAFLILHVSSASVAETKSGSEAVLARASAAFQGQAALRAGAQAPLSTDWFTEDAVYEYSAPAQALSLSWSGRAAVHEHLRSRAARNDEIDMATLYFFPTLAPDVVFAQYQAAGAHARRVVVIVEMRGASIARIREFTQPNVIADALNATAPSTRNVYSKAE